MGLDDQRTERVPVALRGPLGVRAAAGPQRPGVQRIAGPAVGSRDARLQRQDAVVRGVGAELHPLMREDVEQLVVDDRADDVGQARDQRAGGLREVVDPRLATPAHGRRVVAPGATLCGAQGG